MKKIQLLIDRVLRAGIKLCMLTGVAFTLAACYGPTYNFEEPEYQNDQQQLEKRLVDEASEQVN